jgi:hypothetical protein
MQKSGRVPGRRWFEGAIALLLAGVAPALSAQDYLLQMPSVEVTTGESFVLPVEGEWADAVGGFQLSISFPVAAPIQDLAIGIGNTLVGQLEPEFSQFNIALGGGSIVGGVLFETIPPFEGVVLPSLGVPICIAEITGTVPEGAPQEFIPFAFQNGLGTPPVNNTFVIGSTSVPPDTMTAGGLDVRHPPPTAHVFIRGDVNLDTYVDVSDAIFHLSYTFGSGPTPLCLDAGDANDDGMSDISDAIFILYYNFMNGPAPWPPFPNAGTDYTPDTIGCATGL